MKTNRKTTCLIIGGVLIIVAVCALTSLFFTLVILASTPTPALAPTVTATHLVRATLTPGPPYCVCFGRMIECAEFPSQQAAQECLLNCRIQGYDDYYQLDPDLDGRACHP